MQQLKLNIAAEINDDKHTELTFTLANNSPDTIKLDKLCFTFIYARIKKTYSNAKILKQVGTYYELEPPNKVMLEGEEWQFTCIVETILNQYTDLPAGVFAVNGEELVNVEYSKADKIAARIVDMADDVEPVEISKNSRRVNCFPLPNEMVHFSGIADLSRGFALNTDGIFADSFDNAVEIERDFDGDYNLFRLSNQGIELNLIADDGLASEAYRLKIDAQKIDIWAADAAGVHNALMSLWQMAALDKINVACVEINDAPRFEWRGQHLDVARQFFSMDEVKRFINHMALYKLNKFHWHLVDDEAWRVEIKALPQLTEQITSRGYGQMVEPSYGSGAKDEGGFYSQQDMIDIVAYAAKRNIEVIPEIDIPGHCHALIKLMPELLEADDASEYTSVQGYKENCLNPALPQTYDMLDKVFCEISDIFTSEFIHIGADERAHGSWEKSPKVAELMAEYGYNSTEQVQTHFLKQVQEIADRYGKKTGAWEEASEQGDIKKDGYIVSWKGVEAGINAAERGYNVVMSPAQYCYFDMAHSTDFDEPGLTWTGGRVSLQNVYNYDPIPKDISAEIAVHFKGIQGCLWSENLYDKSIVDHQIFPRMIALSEICWVEVTHKNYADFSHDLKQYHQPMLDGLNIQYRRKDFK
ncbi:MAG: beta-N-acetylhexosaminidase [Alphaproteobacteria bacterium]|nr:beta-N-acetylhexosaminidase [Alphaproteobacteria bacterium]